MSFLNPQEMGRALGVGFRRLASASKEPLDIYNAIAGAGQRGVAGAISGKGGKFGVVNPGQSTELTHLAERRLGLPVSNNGIRQGIEDFIFETATDPTTYIPGLDLISGGGRLAKAIRIGKLFEKIPGVEKFLNPGIEKVLKQAVRERGYVGKAATRSGENVVKGIESAGRNVRSRQGLEYEGLVGRNREILDQPGILKQQGFPPDVRQALLQRAYREGSAGVRRKVMRAGYTPTAEERASRPLGILTNFRGEYIPKQRLTPRVELDWDQSPFRVIKQIAPTPGYNLPQKFGDETAPLSERVLDRLKKGAYHEQYYGTRNKTLTDLGLAPAASRPAQVLERLIDARKAGNTKAAERYASLLRRQHAAIKGAEETRGALLKPDTKLLRGTNIPEDIAQRMFGEIVRPNPTFLKGISDAARESLFALTSIPHKFNIGVLQTLGPAGLGGVARGFGYARKLKRGGEGIERRVRDLEGIGGTEHYVRDWEEPSRFANLGPLGRAISARSRASGESLDRWDVGQRLALQDTLAKKGITGFNAGGDIRDVLGDYKSKSELVDNLRNLAGAPFPQWHLGIVPKAVGRALVQNPRGSHLFARAEQLTNQDVMEPMAGADLHVGGPFNEGLKAFTLPFGAWDYLSSGSVTGPLGEANRDVNYLRRGQWPSVASDIFRTYTPGGGLIEDLSGTSNFQHPTNNAATALLGLTGSYLTKAKKPKPGEQLRQSLRDRMYIKGVSKPGIDLLMRQLQVGPRIPRF